MALDHVNVENSIDRVFRQAQLIDGQVYVQARDLNRCFGCMEVKVSPVSEVLVAI